MAFSRRWSRKLSEQGLFSKILGHFSCYSFYPVTWQPESSSDSLPQWQHPPQLLDICTQISAPWVKSLVTSLMSWGQAATFMLTGVFSEGPWGCSALSVRFVSIRWREQLGSAQVTRNHSVAWVWIGAKHERYCMYARKNHQQKAW